jgi:branched-subunit amino acid transport protein
VSSPAALVLATAVLGAGTFAFRLTGPALRARVSLSPRLERLMSLAVVVLLTALVATASLTESHSFAGPARPAGVAVGALLAWRKVSFAPVVVAAATTTALLRLAGVN